MLKKIWKTKMFDIAQERGLSIEKLAELGNYTYKPNYLYKIRNGTRPIPDSFSFQEWVASILAVPREEIFFEVSRTDVHKNMTTVHKGIVKNND